MPELSEVQKRRIARLYDESRSLREHVRDIEQMESADELHQATYLFWNSDPKMWRAIVRHPLCDFGTALKIFWMLELRHGLLQFAHRKDVRHPEILPAYDELEWIEGRLVRNDFRSQQIAFDPMETPVFAPTPRNRKLEECVLKASPGFFCLQDQLIYPMNDEEWRNLIGKELNSVVKDLSNLVQHDPEYQPFLNWFAQRNGVETVPQPEKPRPRSTWMERAVLRAIKMWWKDFNRRSRSLPTEERDELRKKMQSLIDPFTPGIPQKNPQLSDRQRRRLFRIMEMRILNEPREPFVAEMESADELHHLGRRWNRSNGQDETHAILHAILDHPLCDYGTALFIYWKAEPAYNYQKYGSREEITQYQSDVKSFVFLQDVEQKLLTHRFASSRFGFRISELQNVKRLSQMTLKRQIPAVLLQDTPGEQFVDDDLHYETTHQDRILKVLHLLGFCLGDIESRGQLNPVLQNAAERFRQINLSGMQLKDFSPVG